MCYRRTSGVVRDSSLGLIYSSQSTCEPRVMPSSFTISTQVYTICLWTVWRIYCRIDICVLGNCANHSSKCSALHITLYSAENVCQSCLIKVMLLNVFRLRSAVIHRSHTSTVFAMVLLSISCQWFSQNVHKVSLKCDQSAVRSEF